ncbi:MAG: hypothetical protein K6B72_00195 [Lachnospiraceae bacterium]|nr:hypothetical protein [Lachnospiraceae bacterium]
MNLRRRFKTAGAALAALLVCALLHSDAVRAENAETIFEETDEVVYSEAAISASRSESIKLPVADSFAVTIPADFVPDSVPGRFICRRYPLDSANIAVQTILLEDETAFTNAERRAMEERGEAQTRVRREYTNLTADMLEAALNETLEDPLQLKVTKFVSMTLKRDSDGAVFPGFRANAEITGAPKPVTEEIYIVISDTRIFTVTYARASDDEFEEQFRKSAATIAVY